MNIKNKKLISLIVPVFNETDNIRPFYEKIISVISSLESRYNFEIIFTDNHSTDDTFYKISEFSKKDSRIYAMRFSKNFGYQKSILTGYLNARGDAAIQLDCDLQDPPELISVFLQEWEQGAAVVYGVRRTRREGAVMNIFRKMFYRTINYISDDDLPIDSGDFRLIDRRVLDALAHVDDAQPYLRGTISAIGYTQVGVPYDRLERLRGESKFGWGDIFKLATDGILNHSIVPLRIASTFGVLISLVTAILICVYMLGKLYFNFAWPAGFTTLAVLTLLGISVNALFLGIIGEYIGRIYQQVKKRPLTIIERTCGRRDSAPSCESLAHEQSSTP